MIEAGVIKLEQDTTSDSPLHHVHNWLRPPSLISEAVLNEVSTLDRYGVAPYTHADIDWCDVDSGRADQLPQEFRQGQIAHKRREKQPPTK